ncbi:MAG: UDP-N-acetylglucosamine 2-epimerase [Candidatus Muiribacteriota bacterium]
MKRYLFFVSHLYSFAIVRPLQKVIRERGDEVAWFLSHEECSEYLKDDEKRLKTIKDVIEYNPGAVFVASNIVSDFFPGIKVQLFHGFNAQKRDENRGHFRIRGFFDLYCTQGPSTTLPFRELSEKHGFFEVVETGWPKMDPLFDNSIKIEKKSRPRILFTSTFTPSLSAAYKIFDKIKELSSQDKWEWIVTFHPKMDIGVVNKFKSIQSDNLKFIETDNILPLLKNADVMLSDSSSVISEFMLQHKPVVTFRNRMPGPHLINVTKIDQIESALDKALEPPEKLKASIKKYVENIHPYYDGKSSVRVLEATDKLVSRGLSHLKKKPLNFFRKFKIRKKFGYYKL